VTINGKNVKFERAQFGGTVDAPYVELHVGGDPACPTKQSPTPAYTLILNLSEGAAAASFLDFRGDIITTPQPFVKATKIETSKTVGTARDFVSLDATLTLPNGSGKGHIFATHCASLDP
jgi:hypothetical protein